MKKKNRKLEMNGKSKNTVKTPVYFVYQIFEKESIPMVNVFASFLLAFGQKDCALLFLFLKSGKNTVLCFAVLTRYWKQIVLGLYYLIIGTGYFSSRAVIKML